MIADSICDSSTGAVPSFPLVRAVSEGWSDAQLGYLHALSCEDPLTGLTSINHVRTRLGDAYRESARAGAEPHVALVVIDIVDRSETSRLLPESGALAASAPSWVI